MEFLNLPFSCPWMSFLLNLELNSCIKNHRWEIIPKLWCYLFVCPGSEFVAYGILVKDCEPQLETLFCVVREMKRGHVSP